MGQASDTRNQVVDVPAFGDDDGHKRTASRGPAPPPAPADHLVDLEAQPQPVGPTAIPVYSEAQHKQKAAADYDQENLDWAVKMIGFCLPPAVAIAFQFLKTDQSHELPLAFHFLSLAIILSFNSLFLSKFIATEFPEIAKLLKRVGVFLAVTATYIAINIPLPALLRCVTWTVYVVSCIAMVFSHGSF